jgi:hypothetical protein
MTPRAALERAVQQSGQAARLVDRYERGGDGAFRVTVDGMPRVFKYWSGERAAGLRLATAVRAYDVLKQCGWPLPTLHAWHSDPAFAFVMEAPMNGHHVEGVPEELCSRLLALLDAVPHGGGAGADAQDWVSFLEQSLYQDLPLSPCRPLALLTTPRGRRIVEHARQAFAAARPRLAAARDVIHGDFSPGNMLCDESGALTAVLDWHQAGIGHRGFDLIGLEWDLALSLSAGSAASLERVTALVNERVEEPVRAFCRAYYAVWNMSWAHKTLDEADVLQAAEVLGIA